MTDQNNTGKEEPSLGISEAERMARVRELLVGPAIADQSVVINQAIDSLSERIREQQETIATLRSRIQELEDSHRINTSKLQTRLLGVAEALLANDEDLRPRLTNNEAFNGKLDDDGGGDKT